jgi:hypothetical protein
VGWEAVRGRIRVSIFGHTRQRLYTMSVRGRTSAAQNKSSIRRGTRAPDGGWVADGCSTVMLLFWEGVLAVDFDNHIDIKRNRLIVQGRGTEMRLADPFDYSGIQIPVGRLDDPDVLRVALLVHPQGKHHF